MPSRYLVLLRKVNLFSAEYKLNNSRVPTISEIVKQTKSNHYDIAKVLTMQQYPVLLNSPVSTGSQKQQMDGGKERTYEELLPSTFKLPMAQSGSKDIRREMEQMMLVNLNDVERDVLRLRLGLDDGRAKPVKEVGKRFKISWKQVRSLEKEAILKLKKCDEINDFVSSVSLQ
jgi:DNA-directed RNA polymerase sigma subunit (sigma70/sigma32)